MDANIVVVVIVALVAVFAAVAALFAARSHRTAEHTAQVSQQLSDALNQASGVLAVISRQQVEDGTVLKERFETLTNQTRALNDRTDDLRREITAGQDKTRETVERQLDSIRKDNETQLTRMRETVDEKLSTTLNERLSSSFKQVSEQLDTVSKGLGEMRTVATGVGDLKRVLSNVKTRGILGEVQLGAILAEIMTPDQYLTDVATVPESSERVEFAVKVPVDGGKPVLLPIDSKFPADTYEHVRQALDDADAASIAAARGTLQKTLKGEAKDISEKYIAVPSTTNFAIMFLPFEGLYAEVVNMPGLVETLQRDYRVVIAGPSTMAAVLNSLQLSYQTFAFQKRADEIQRVLAAVKAEFPNYQKELERALKQIKTAEKTVDNIISTRTNVMERKLRSVTALTDVAEAQRVLREGDDEVIMLEAEPAEEDSPEETK